MILKNICNIKIKDFLLCQYVIYGPRKKSIIDKYCIKINVDIILNILYILSSIHRAIPHPPIMT
jgi:hypothetical protein